MLCALSLWGRTGIPTRQEHHIFAKLIALFEELRKLLKSKEKNQSSSRQKKEPFKENLKDLFNMKHYNAMKMIKEI